MFFAESAVWGHRGWPSRFPDNVLAGIRAAATVAAGVEVDIRRTADGRLVLAHDPVLAGKAVAEHHWQELAVVDIGGHTPALLEDLVDLPVPLDLEVKNDPSEPGFEPDHRTALEVADWARPGDVVTSFWWPSVDAVRRHRPHVATGLLFTAGIDWKAAVRHAVEAGHGWLAPEFDVIGPELVAAASRAGIELAAWTVDDPSEAARLAELGVAAIISNRPGELITDYRSSE